MQQESSLMLHCINAHSVDTHICSGFLLLKGCSVSCCWSHTLLCSCKGLSSLSKSSTPCSSTG